MATLEFYHRFYDIYSLRKSNDLHLSIQTVESNSYRNSECPNSMVSVDSVGRNNNYENLISILLAAKLHFILLSIHQVLIQL